MSVVTLTAAQVQAALARIPETWTDLLDRRVVDITVPRAVPHEAYNRIVGELGEEAVRQYYSIPACAPDDYVLGLPDVGPFEVRSTDYLTGRLHIDRADLARGDTKMRRPYVLVIVHLTPTTHLPAPVVCNLRGYASGMTVYRHGTLERHRDDAWYLDNDLLLPLPTPEQLPLFTIACAEWQPAS